MRTAQRRRATKESRLESEARAPTQMNIHSAVHLHSGAQRCQPAQCQYGERLVEEWSENVMAMCEKFS